METQSSEFRKFRIYFTDAFSQKHNATLDRMIGWDEGATLKLYQKDQSIIRLAKRAILLALTEVCTEPPHLPHYEDGPQAEDEQGRMYPSVFSHDHNEWLERHFNLENGEILRIYQHDPDLIDAAKAFLGHESRLFSVRSHNSVRDYPNTVPQTSTHSRAEPQPAGETLGKQRASIGRNAREEAQAQRLAEAEKHARNNMNRDPTKRRPVPQHPMSEKHDQTPQAKAFQSRQPKPAFARDDSLRRVMNVPSSQKQRFDPNAGASTMRGRGPIFEGF